MGLVAAFIMVTVDGFVEGDGGAFDFWTVDAEFERFSDDQLDQFDVLVFGRRTFEGMAEFWPTPAAIEASPPTARRMNTMAKVVVSTTLSSVDWQPTDVVSSVDELIARVRDSDESMLVLGSAHLVGSLVRAGALDELRLMVNPVAIGSGSSLGDSLGVRVDLVVDDVRRFDSGNVLVTYLPAGRSGARGR